MDHIVPLQSSPLINHLCVAAGVQSLHDLLGISALIIPEQGSGYLPFMTTVTRIGHYIPKDPESMEFTEELFLSLSTEGTDETESEVQLIHMIDLTYQCRWSVTTPKGKVDWVEGEIFLGKENRQLSP